LTFNYDRDREKEKEEEREREKNHMAEINHSLENEPVGSFVRRNSDFIISKINRMK